MFKKEEKIKVYGKYLRRLYNRAYLTSARKGILSEAGGRRYTNKLFKKGFITFYKGKEGKKFVNFSKKGIKLLKEYGILGGFDENKRDI